MSTSPVVYLIPWQEIIKLKNTFFHIQGLSFCLFPNGAVATVNDRQMGHVNQMGHLSKTPLNSLEIQEIGSVDTSESKQQNYD